MASKTKTPEPEYDFDSFDEAAEQAAIAALVPDIKHIIVGGDFIGRFSDGQTVRLPLSITLDDVDQLEQADLSPVDQVKHLLSTIGGKTEAAKFSKHSLLEATALASRYFAVFERVNQASLPE